MSLFDLSGTIVQEPPTGAYIISFPTDGYIKNISDKDIDVTYYLIGGGGGGSKGSNTIPKGGGGGGAGQIKSGILTLSQGVQYDIIIGMPGFGADYPVIPGGVSGGNTYISSGGSPLFSALGGGGSSGGVGGGAAGGNGADNIPTRNGGQGSMLSGPISAVITDIFSSGGGGGAGDAPKNIPTTAGTGAGLGGTLNNRGSDATTPGSGGGGGSGSSNFGGTGAVGIAYLYYMLPTPPPPTSQVKKLYLVQPPTLFTNTPPRVINFSYTIGASPTLSLTVLKSSISTNYSIVRLNCFKITNGSQTYTNITTMPLASGSYSATVTLTPLTVSLNNLVKFELIRLQGFKNGKWYTIGYLKRRQYKIV